MIQGNRRPAEQPVPLIDAARCDGCGLCVRVCPTGALAVKDGKAIVATPEACNYTGLCEAICPTRAIQRPFEIVALDEEATKTEGTRMKIVKALEAQGAPNPHGVSARGLHETEHVQAVMVTLQPGESLKRHVTSVDVFFYVLAGRGIVEIGDELEEVSPDMLIVSPARIPHRLLNESDAMFRFLVVKTPRPTKATKIL